MNWKDFELIAHANHHRQVDEGYTNQQNQNERFGDVEYRPGNVAAAAVPSTHKIEQREQPQEAARRPHQHRLLETFGKVGVFMSPTQFGVLKIDSRSQT